jgi:hypothetical protein
MEGSVMSNIRRVEYFHATVKDRPGEAYVLLSQLASSGVNLLAFSAIPAGLEHTQLMLFPESVEQLLRVAAATGLVLTGPQHAIMIQGDDRLGALADIHDKLAAAQINVYSSNGVADGRGGYGYIVFVRTEDFDRASRALDL